MDNGGKISMELGDNKNGLPSVEEAEVMLRKAEKLNTESWVQHWIYAEKAAKAIA